MLRRRAQCDVLVIPQLVSILPHIFLLKFYARLLLLLLRVVVVALLLLLLLRRLLLLLLLLVVVAGGNRAYCRIFVSPKNRHIGGVFAYF